MSQISFSAAMPRYDLDQESEDFTFAQNVFAADHVFPGYDVSERVGDFSKIVVGTGGELLGDDVVRREEGGRFAELTYEKVRDTYVTEEFGLEGMIDRRRTGRNAAERERDTRRKARNAMLGVMRHREQRVIDRTINNTVDFAAGNGNASSVTTPWTNPASTPIDDIQTAIDAVKSNCGMRLNTVVIPDEARKDIGATDEYLSRVPDNMVIPGRVNTEWLAEQLEVETLVFPFVSYDAAARGRPASMANIWPRNKVLLLVSTDMDDLEPVQLGRTIFNDEYSGRGSFGEYPDDPRHSDGVFYFQERDDKLLNRLAGYVLTIG